MSHQYKFDITSIANALMTDMLRFCQNNQLSMAEMITHEQTHDIVLAAIKETVINNHHYLYDAFAACVVGWNSKHFKAIYTDFYNEVMATTMLNVGAALRTKINTANQITEVRREGSLCIITWAA